MNAFFMPHLLYELAIIALMLMAYNRRLRNLLQHLLGQGSVCVTSHISPDGDSVGSILGLVRYLKKCGLKAFGCMKDRVPEVFSFMVKPGEITHELPETDVYVLVDASEWERTGYPKPNKGIIRIDHHLTGKRYSEYDVLDEGAPSATSVVLDILRSWDEDLIDLEIALPLYVGLLTDTGGFKNREGVRSFEDAAYLVKRGVNPKEVAEKIFREKDLLTYKLLQKALQTLRVVKGKVAYMIVRKEFFEETGARSEHSESFVEYPLSVRGVVVAFKMEWDERGFWRVGIRSKIGGPNVAEIAERFGGGGHYFSAGFRIKGSEEEALSRILGEVLKVV